MSPLKGKIMSRKDSSKTAKRLISKIRPEDRIAVWCGEKDLLDLGIACDKALRRAIRDILDSWVMDRATFAEDGAMELA
jgi:hypothetical protein